MAEVNFDGARLTDADFKTSDLARASFRGARLVRVDFSMTGLAGASFPAAGSMLRVEIPLLPGITGLLARHQIVDVVRVGQTARRSLRTPGDVIL